MNKRKIVVGTYPFGEESKKLLKDLDVTYGYFERKIPEREMMKILKKVDPIAIIAGVEIYNKKILDLCSNLKLISRVGIGLDSLDLEECKRRKIIVTNTPDAPSNSVAELTIGQMLNALRRTQWSDQEIREGKWNRYIGRDLSDCYIGVIGHGRIGKRVVRKLEGFNPLEIYINDIDPNQLKNVEEKRISSLEHILKNSDIITIHIPLNENNKNLISEKELNLMKKNAIIMNFSRGGIVNEEDLYQWLTQNKNISAVIDNFVEEPYSGKLIKLKNCYLTPHLGSCTKKSRYDMETGAVKEVLNLINGKKFNSRVI